MRLVYKNGDYFPPSDFKLEVKRGKSDPEATALDAARATAACLGAIPGVTTRIGGWAVPPVSVSLDPALRKDLVARADVIEQMLGVLDTLGLRYTPLSIVDLVSEPYRAGHAWRDRDVLREFGPDPVRFERLQALRLPSVADFFSGVRPVTDAAVFVEFHTALDAYEQALVRHIAKEGSALIGQPCPDGCHRSWTEQPASALLGRGWLVMVSGELHAGPKLGRLNQAAGELMAD
jgi:hypothetical protein